MKIKKIIYNPYLVGTITALIAAIILNIIFKWVVILFEWIKTLKVIPITIVNKFIYKVKIPVWGLILVFFAFPIIYLILKFFISIDGEKFELRQVLINKYTEDNFSGLKYRWSWVKGVDGKYTINNLTPYCPQCDCRLSLYTSIINPHYYCPSCDFTTSRSQKLPVESDIEKLIHHKLTKQFEDLLRSLQNE